MKRLIITTVLVMGISAHANAQEAFVTQVSNITVRTESPAVLQVSAREFTTAAVSNVNVFSPVVSDFQYSLLPNAPTLDATALVFQEGTTNSASILQDGLQAALIQQSGQSGFAQIQQ
jgi:hypothetical protein